MKNNSILMPLFKTIDKILFGITEINEIEKVDEFIDSDNEEEFDVERSSN
ncbi:hypothetical protein [Legionella bononiensis]|uniref:Uncharacterized protein n=1 Tax=Legionella bononiensis TaxID=2793102 RepID=A0ABS1WG48_9GAMM|nr:hypothetical protein [Legionella bononiensis]MBL7481778.1 hypothetical protein [Legionella bononiensis]MBL7528327.1 hypothetical protein [Legionella bononiensis]MBL7564290.1 hypothetical protein [Legionella bononiensis]